MKKCSKCNIEKDICDFHNTKCWCIACEKEYKRQHYLNNKDRYKELNKQYRLNNKNSISETKKIYTDINKNIIKEYQSTYRKNNKDKIKEYNKKYHLLKKKELNIYGKEYRKNRKRKDPIFKCRCIISNSIYKILKYNKQESCLKYLPYSIEELTIHLENLFESWMNWNNYGKYNVDVWDDNDQSTWTWNIDHIIPQSNLPYTSMEDDNFNKCWSLNNLRPYSAKLNLIDGASRIRHVF